MGDRRRGRGEVATIEGIVRSIHRPLVPMVEVRLRAELARREREWLIDQVVRLTLDAHSLQEMDRRSVVEAKVRARRERLERVKSLGLDDAVLQAFVAEHASTTRDGLM